jgi:hypothetical protein
MNLLRRRLRQQCNDYKDMKKTFFPAILITLLLADVALGESFSGRPCDTESLKALSLKTVQSDLVDCNLQKDKKCFYAGDFWHQFWVRDTSYSSLMGLYKLYPEELKNTFKELVLMNGSRDYPAQDLASDFGGFPYQTDSIVWVIGAFELAKETHDEEFRRYVYEVGKKMSVKWKSAVDKSDGLIFGAPSFLDSWASFPKEWKGNPRVFLRKKFLSTNVLWMRFGEIMAWERARYENLSGEVLEKELGVLRKKIHNLNEKFINREKGYYNYYIGSDKYEALGNGLIQKFKMNSYRIMHVKTGENFYPAHFPMFDFRIPGNWYSETVQHVWVDAFLASIDREPLAEFCNKYSAVLSNRQDVAELIQGGRMFGGGSQLWAATAVYFYLDGI